MNNNGKLIIQAMNINQGGGLTLLMPLLKSEGTHRTIFFLDSRLKEKTNNLLAPDSVYWIHPKLLNRLFAYWKTMRIASECDTAIFFGNLPPIFKMPCKTYVYLQNKLLIDRSSLAQFSIKTRVRLLLERVFFSNFRHNADIYFVQSASMARELRQRFTKDQLTIEIFPYTERGVSRAKSIHTSAKRQYDFIYPASSDAHKNHFNLLLAWKILFDEGIFPSLVLTLPDSYFYSLLQRAGFFDQNDAAHIVNLGILPKNQLDVIYGKCSALIFPSFTESFGLPLLEAEEAGLAILASEMDYVRDVVNPTESFNPHSATSISRAVQRYLGLDIKKQTIHNAQEFLKHINS